MRSSQKISRLLGCLLLAAAVLAAPASAGSGAARSASHDVHPGQSIQAAVDSASPGDTIVVREGTYRESVVIQKDGISLRARGDVRLKPPEDGSGLCNTPDEQIGFCVVPADLDLDTFTYTTRVRDVTITGFRVLGFRGDGILGFGTENLTVSHVRAADNTEYGIASFDGIGTRFVHNRASGSEDAGLYVGDSPDANAVVSDNVTRHNALGVLVRHARHVVVAHNRAWGNCLGVLLLDDRQPGGSGDNAVLDNRFIANNDECPQFAGFLGATPGGGGIVAIGSQHNVIAHNLVLANRGDTPFSGGIVLVATQEDDQGEISASTNNAVLENRLRFNTPADIVQDDASSPNLIAHNHCRTSMPPGLCG